MITEDQVAFLFAKANPVPSLALLDPVEPMDLEHLERRSERSSTMTEVKTKGSGGEVRRWNLSLGPVMLVIGVVIAIGIAMVMANLGPQIAATPLDNATAFWVAVSDGDRETAIGYLDPAAADSGQANIHGRAATLADQFDWYEVVDWRWTLDQCIEVDQGLVECTVAGRNAWSDAIIGVEPVTGTFVMETGENGITAIVDKDEAFLLQWSDVAFEVFAAWVEAYHPGDAAIMFDFEVDMNQEILDLYEINTTRFLEARIGS